MNQVWISTYQLGQSSEGFLIKIVDQDSNFGVADCFPHSFLKDASVQQQLLLLRDKRPTELVQQAIRLAKKDLEFRKQKKNVFENQPAIKNHKTILDICQAKAHDLVGFSSIKIKIGKNLDNETNAINSLFFNTNLKIRLDANAQFHMSSFKNFWQKLDPNVQKQVEFIEDPVPYNLSDWQQISALVPVAMDNEMEKWSHGDKNPFQYLVLKPVRINYDESLFEKFKLVVTSSLDHPVGVAHALWYAMQLKQKFGDKVLDSGCATNDVYLKNSFSEQMKFEGAKFIGNSGYGIGFDNLLERQSWQRII